MRHLLLTITLVACAALVMAPTSFARTPDPSKCTVSDDMINTCPYAHDALTQGSTERYVDLIVTVVNENYDPVSPPIPAADFSFAVNPHSAYPNLGGGASGDCAGCEGEYSVYCIDAATNIDGEMTIRVDLGTDCAPSMCCPVEVWVTLPQGTIIDPGEVVMNTMDMVADGDVRGPDFGAFSTAYTAGTGGSLEECADFILTVPTWGTIDGSDFAAFSTHYKDCCGSMKESNPVNCDPFTDPCP